MNKVIQDLQDIGKQLKEKNMLLGNAGNISIIEDNKIYITGSQTYLDTLQEQDISICNMNGSFEGIRPSKEFGLHQAIYQSSPNTKCIIHCSPYYATCVACSDINLKTNLFVESMRYLQNIQRIPYAHPGSKQLHEYVQAVCQLTNVILMEQHGVLVYGDSIKEAMTTLDVLEYCCRMNLQCYHNLKEVSSSQVHDFLCTSGYYSKEI